MAEKETLSDLIKGYEANYDLTLPKRTPLILLVDGKAFHTFTSGFDKPFDEIFIKSMQETMKMLCENIQFLCLMILEVYYIVLFDIFHKH